MTNLYLNYTVRSTSRFDNSKLRLSLNNVLDTRNIIGVTAATTGTIFRPAAGDTSGLTPGRSSTVSFVIGLGNGR